MPRVWTQRRILHFESWLFVGLNGGGRMTFEEEYKESVEFQSEYILKDLRDMAKNNDYEPDIFIRHVLNKVNELNRKGEVEK